MPLIGSLAALGLFRRASASAPLPGTQILAVAANTTVLHNAANSNDGATWVSATAPSSAAANFSYNDAAYGASRYVFVGSNGTIYSSSDGTTWSTQAFSGVTWNSVIFENSLFVAVGNVATALGCATSLDGVTWTARTMPSTGTNWNSVAYGNGLYLAVASSSSTSATSPDGITWTARTSGGSLANVTLVFGGTEAYFVMLGNSSTFYVSNTGLASPWITRTLPSTGNWGVAYGNGIFVAVNRSSSNAILLSYDAVSWQATTLPVTGSWTTPIFIGDRFIILGTSASNVALESTDGRTWTQSTLPFTDNWNALSSPVKANTSNVVITALPSNTTSTTAYASTDGQVWAPIPIPKSSLATKTVYSHGVQIFYGGGAALVSTNGVSWAAAPQADNFTSIDAINGKFYAVNGTTSTGFESTDGITWTASTLPSNTWNLVHYSQYNNYFFAIAGTSLYYSPDGITWTANTNSLASTAIDIATSPGGLYVLYSGGASVGRITPNTGPTFNISTTSLSVGGPYTNLVGCTIPSLIVAYRTGSTDCVNVTTPSTLRTAPAALSQMLASPRYYLLAKSSTSPNTYYTTYNLTSWSTYALPNNIDAQYFSIRNQTPVNLLFRNGIAGGRMASSDGVFLNPLTSPLLASTNAVFGGGKFLSITLSASLATTTNYLYSMDGYVWTTATFPSAVRVSNVSYVNGYFMFLDNVTNKVYSSSNGIDWDVSTTVVKSTATVYRQSIFAYGVDTYVCMYDTSIWTSSDRITWTSTTQSVATNSVGIVYLTSAAKFVTALTNGSVRIPYYSTDGVAWTSASPLTGTAFSLFTLTASDNIAVLTGSSFRVFWSTDGVAWTLGTSPGGIDIQNASYGIIGFVGLGSNAFDATVVTSKDGKTWVSSPGGSYFQANNGYTANIIAIRR